MGGLVIPHGYRMSPCPADDRRAGNDAVVIVGIMLRLDQSLLAACGAAGEIGSLGRGAVEGRGDLLAGDRHDVCREQPPILPFLRMTDERVAIEIFGWRGPHVRGRGGVAAPDTRLHPAIAGPERARIAAIAIAVEDAAPAFLRQPNLDADIGIGRFLY